MRTSKRSISLLAVMTVSFFALSHDSKTLVNFRMIASSESKPVIEKKPDEKPVDVVECQNKIIQQLTKEVADKMKSLDEVLANQKKSKAKKAEDEALDSLEEKYSDYSKRDLLREILERTTSFNMPSLPMPQMPQQFVMPHSLYTLPAYQNSNFSEQSIAAEFNYRSRLLELEYTQQRRMMELSLTNSIGANTNSIDPYSRYQRNWTFNEAALPQQYLPVHRENLYTHPFQAENSFRPMPISDNNGQYYLANQLASLPALGQKGFQF